MNLKNQKYFGIWFTLGPQKPKKISWNDLVLNLLENDLKSNPLKAFESNFVIFLNDHRDTWACLEIKVIFCIYGLFAKISWNKKLKKLTFSISLDCEESALNPSYFKYGKQFQNFGNYEILSQLWTTRPLIKSLLLYLGCDPTFLRKEGSKNVHLDSIFTGLSEANLKKLEISNEQLEIESYHVI